MDAKQYLKQAYRLNELIESNQMELEELRELSVSVSGVDPSKEPGGVHNSGDAGFTRIVMKIVELENMIKSDIERLLNLKLEIRNVINRIEDNEQRLVLKLRYLNFMNWDSVGESMNVSSRTAMRIHDAALLNIKDF